MPNKRDRTKKIMEYDDAPSGYVTLYNYKEPFMKFDEGYGYRGTLLFDGKTDTIQCHFCGEWQTNLHHHLKREHSMNAAQYKERVGLLKTTALINESLRASLIAKGMDKRLLNLRPHRKHTEESKQKIRSSVLQNGKRMELKNITGTCPLQLLTRLQKRATELGRCPASREIGFRNTLVKVFGSFSNACLKAGLDPLKIGQNVNYRANERKAYTQEEIISELQEFKSRHNRYPACSDYRRKLIPTPAVYKRLFGGWCNARKAAFPEFDQETRKPLIIQDILIGTTDIRELTKKHQASPKFIWSIIKETRERLERFEKMKVPA